jgi:phosphatidylserine/phosphatidylglycerophosphate/cardiolipin synthase-like enzyme
MGTGGPGWLPNFLSSTGQRVTARSYLKLLNFKANHRKLIVTEKECLVTSANPHDASGFHSNIAFAGAGGLCSDLLESERAVAAFSDASVEGWPVMVSASQTTAPGSDPNDGVTMEPEVQTATLAPMNGPGGRATESGRIGTRSTSAGGTAQLVTEGEILEAVLADVRATGAGDRVDLAMFYLSERKVVDAVLKAEERGATVRLILDPNKDAFGRQKGGVPNRQVASELVRRSEGRIGVRWYDTRGEQFHTKLVVTTRGDSITVMGGSANMTRRNLNDYNLETDLRFVLPTDAKLAVAVSEYYSRLFQNKGGHYTLAFDAYRDDRWLKRIQYRFQEFTGLSSF